MAEIDSAKGSRFPPDLPVWRKHFFAVGDVLRISAREFEARWPYVDKFWSA